MAPREVFRCERCARPPSDPFDCQSTPVGSTCGPLAELGRRTCGANVAGWLNATVPLGDYGIGDYATFSDVLTNNTGRRVGTEAGSGLITRVSAAGAQIFFSMAIHL